MGVGASVALKLRFFQGRVLAWHVRMVCSRIEN